MVAMLVRLASSAMELFIALGAATPSVTSIWAVQTPAFVGLTSSKRWAGPALHWYTGRHECYMLDQTTNGSTRQLSPQTTHEAAMCQLAGCCF